MKFMKINEIIRFHDISYQNHKETDDLKHEKHRKSLDFHDFEYFSVSFAILDSSIFIGNSAKTTKIIKMKKNEKFHVFSWNIDFKSRKGYTKRIKIYENWWFSLFFMLLGHQLRWFQADFMKYRPKRADFHVNLSISFSRLSWVIAHESCKIIKSLDFEEKH